MTGDDALLDEHYPLVGARAERIEVAEGLRLRIIDRRPERTDGSLPAVLLIHGLASNARMWDGVGTCLVRQNVRSIAVDLRGHGRSDKPDDGYDFDSVVSDLVGLLDRLDIERAVFVGQSWGGNVVVHAAHRRPQRVVGAVAVDGGMIELGRTFNSWDDCAAALRPPNLVGTRHGRMEAAMRSMNADWPESGIVGALSNFEVVGDGTIRPWLTLDRHMQILRELWSHQPSEMFADIERPILFVPADSGDVAWTRNKEMAVDHALRTLPNARAHWFRPAHHDLHAQHPERFAEVLVSNMKNGFLA